MTKVTLACGVGTGESEAVSTSVIQLNVFTIQYSEFKSTEFNVYVERYTKTIQCHLKFFFTFGSV